MSTYEVLHNLRDLRKKREPDMLLSGLLCYDGRREREREDVKMKKALQKRAAEIVAQNTGTGTHCVLAQLDLDGAPTAAAVTAAGAEGIRVITFGTGLGSNKAKRIAKDNRASVCFCSEEYNITLIGTMEIVTDLQTRRDSWYAGMENHFPGPEDPNYCVLRFTTTRYNLLVDWQEDVGAY